jgi:hypothetical protein
VKKISGVSTEMLRISVTNVNLFITSQTSTTRMLVLEI